MGILVQLLANVNRDSQQRPQAFQLEEVMEWFGYAFEDEPPPPEAPRPTAEELRQKLAMLKEMFPSGNGESPQA